jgi:pilus assembly protein FimV
MPPSLLACLSRRFGFLVFLASCSVAVPVQAAALGELTVQSRLGEPLQAEVRLVGVTPQESSSLRATLAPEAAFKRANIPFDPVLASLTFGLMQRDGDYVVTISSDTPVAHLAIGMLLELSSESSRLIREYTLFIDPSEPVGSRDKTADGVALTDYVAASATDSTLFRVKSALRQAPTGVEAPAVKATLPDKIAYTIRSDDFLGGIASRFKADDISVYQMMVAIFKTNPSAFVGNNINRMRVGRILLIPDEVTVRNISQSEARSLVIQQGKAYRSGVLDVPDVDGWQPSPQ